MSVTLITHSIIEEVIYVVAPFSQYLNSNLLMTYSWVSHPYPEAHSNLQSVLRVNGWISSPALTASRLILHVFNTNATQEQLPFKYTAFGFACGYQVKISSSRHM